MIDTSRYVGQKLGGVINRFMADEYRLSDIDAARFAGRKLGGVINKLLDDSPSKDLGIKMVTPFTLLLVALLGLAAVVGAYRLVFGIGAASNLNDLWPWGLWIGFDVLGGVAMAAGAFLIAAAVYILNWKKYKCIARASILNAFFGYLLAAISITLDIGRSFVIWHPLVMWQITRSCSSSPCISCSTSLPWARNQAPWSLRNSAGTAPCTLSAASWSEQSCSAWRCRCSTSPPWGRTT